MKTSNNANMILKIFKKQNAFREWKFLVFFFALLILFALFAITPAQAAMLYFYPQTVDVVQGEDLSFELRLNTEGEAVNALSVKGFLDNRHLIAKSIENSGSIISLFVEPPTLESQSAFSLTGGIPGGFSGDGVIARIMLRAQEEGQSLLKISPDSHVYRHSDTAEQAVLKTLEANIRVLPRSDDYIVLTSLSHPDPNQWYVTQPVIMKWELEPGAAYSYLISHDPAESPDDQVDQPEGDLQWQGQIQIDGVGEGIYYFSVKKVDSAGSPQVGSDVVSRWKIMNDATLPVWTVLEISPGTLETEGRSFISFLAQDIQSGVEYYEAKFDNEESHVVTSPYPLPETFSILTLKAFDRAGNFLEKSIPGKGRTLWPWMVVVVIIVAVRIFGLQRKKRIENH